ncbi:hypothetical protein NLJ89_g12164 [Agrocybe chaxingu]|uniref:Uncharacterized protein n=1 Tax=Agrocybe chaxingu TaxID=84603 RepID=A0A9W8JNM8_9AGAR|nr:hypothetical protein NLJ89_g12164 [Agrocybe chaxingu]
MSSHTLDTYDLPLNNDGDGRAHASSIIPFVVVDEQGIVVESNRGRGYEDWACNDVFELMTVSASALRKGTTSFGPGQKGSAWDGGMRCTLVLSVSRPSTRLLGLTFVPGRVERIYAMRKEAQGVYLRDAGRYGMDGSSPALSSFSAVPSPLNVAAADAKTRHQAQGTALGSKASIVYDLNADAADEQRCLVTLRIALNSVATSYSR